MNRRLNDAVSDASYCMESCSHLRKVNVAGQFASFQCNIPTVACSTEEYHETLRENSRCFSRSSNLVCIRP